MGKQATPDAAAGPPVAIRAGTVAGENAPATNRPWALPRSSTLFRSWPTLLVLAVMAAGFTHTLLFQPQQVDRQQSPPEDAAASNDQGSGTRPILASSPTTLLTTAAAKNEQVIAQTQLDPSLDGWESEAVAEQAKQQLTRLGLCLAGESLESLLATEVAPTVRCGPLRPTALVEVFKRGENDTQIVVRQAASDAIVAADQQGHDALIGVFNELALPLSAASDVHVHFKVIRVTTTSDTAETTALFEADGHVAGGIVQQRATWDCRWQRLPEGKLQLTSIQASKYQEAVTTGPWLVDCTRAVLGQNRSFDQQLAFGLNHWLSRLDKVNGMHVFTRNGLAVGDVNGDGFDDVYVCQPGGLPNRLFVQQTDGTAVDRSREAGVDWLDQTSSALLIDLDNDGHQDLVAATVSGLLVMQNNGQGQFRLRCTLATSDTDTQSFAAADYDNDGDIDLYVCLEFAKQMSLQYDTDVTFVYHDANDGAANVLFRNDITGGNWKFTDVTQQTGMDEDNRRHSLACAWEDFDNDGDQDLYVANDYGQNCLYENINGQFKNVAAAAQVVDSASGMSVSWGDYNRDGQMDLYVANMFSSAGNRITRQQQFKSAAGDRLRDVYSRFAKGNTLLKNDGNGHFQDVGGLAGVEMARWAWSSVFADLNNDTREDLLVANGYITTEDSGDL